MSDEGTAKRLDARGDPSSRCYDAGRTLEAEGERAERDVAYKKLINAGEPGVPVLIDTLNDGDPAVREYAAAALGEIGDRQAVKPLLAFLHSDKERRYIAAWALGKMKAAEAVPDLIGMLAPS